jgi:uncharacterized protein YjbI with pentapeptide repeats
MNKYIRKLFRVLFQSQQTRQVVRIQPQHSPTSPEEWRQHWQSQGQHWRTEPEIDSRRQAELAQRRAVVPNIEQGIYPFKGVELDRADIEWLLETHENGRGPVDWSDESQREREGLDLRGADLSLLNLAGLPLARLRAGLTLQERHGVTEVWRNLSVVLLRGADLYKAHLEGANFYKADLENANLARAHLDRAFFYRTRLDGAILTGAHLEGAYFYRTSLRDTTLEGVSLSNEMHIGPYLTDISWDGVNLAVVNWTQIQMLGNVYEARQAMANGQVKSRTKHIDGYENAVRANRQLAVALQNQGLNEEAAHFAHRAQILQRKRLWLQREVGRWFFSLLLAVLAGYGYRMWRILAAYLLVVSACAVAYFVIGIYHPPHLTLLQAFLESITAFHGRVFYELFTPDTPQIWVTAFEAIAGLVIESVFIAMLTQRFFGK